MTVSIKVGDTIPEGKFKTIPYVPEMQSIEACGTPIEITTESWKGIRVVLFTIPGAFTPTCHGKHLPQFIEKSEQIRERDVDVLSVMASNDAYVMSGWLRFSGVKMQLSSLSDDGAKWCDSMGLSSDLTARGLSGLRTARFAMIIDDLVVKYIGVEHEKGVVTVSGADAVLEALSKLDLEP